MMIKTIGVIGAGTMGTGIAQVFAQSGFTVTLVDVAQPLLDRARATIERSLGKFVEKGKLTASGRDASLGRLQTATSIDQLSDADYVVEASDGAAHPRRLHRARRLPGDPQRVA